MLLILVTASPFETTSQPNQIQWNLMSGTFELQGYDFPILRLSIKLIGKPYQKLSHLTISSVHGPEPFEAQICLILKLVTNPLGNLSETYQIQWILMFGHLSHPRLDFSYSGACQKSL